MDEEARNHLAGLCLPDEFAGASLISSPLCRAVETARIVARREPLVAPELIEMDWGRWEGQSGLDLLADPVSGYRHLEDWGWDYEPPGGETPRRVWDRISPWVATLRGPAVIISHIGVMRVLLARATGWNFEGKPPFQVKRDRLYKVDILEDGSLQFDMQPVRLNVTTDR